MKAGLIGPLQRSGIPASAAVSPGGFVIQIPWSQLEPTEGTLNTAQIDSALAAAVKLMLKCKLRVMGGIDAPAWLLARVGTVANYVEGATGAKYTIPKSWTQPFIDAYTAREHLLAAKYDGNPTLATVVCGAPTAVYDEPFQLCNPHSASVLAAAGYTDALFVSAIEGAISAHKAWLQTSTALAFNDFKKVGGGIDYTVVDQVMGFMRTTLGPSAIIENNSWRTGFKWSDTLYALMHKHGAPLCLQTAAASKITDMVSAMDVAVSEPGLYSVELPSAQGGLTTAQLAAYQATMKKNAGSGSPPPPPPPARRVGAVDRRAPGGTRP